MSELSLRGKTALITGGSTEVARTVAAALAHRGAQIYLCGKQAAMLELAAEKIRADGGLCRTSAVDFDDLEGAEATVADAHAEFGGLDILIIVSPFWAGGQIHAHSPKTWDLVLNANLRESFLVARAALPVFREQKHGELMVIGSDSALGVYPQDGAYSVALHALSALLELIRVENAEFGIRTHSLAPGVTVSEGVDSQGRPALSANDVADWAVWLLTRPSHLRGNGPILV